MNEYSPSLILLINGKRKSGKDFFAELLHKRLGDERSVIVRLSAPIKSRFAQEYRLDYNKLLSDSDYKERYRQEMIVWGERMRAVDPGYFCRLALEMVPAAGRAPVWIVSDTRRRTDISWFRECYGERVKTVHIKANLTVRELRGFVFTKGVDDAESECDLDGVADWDLTVLNNGDPRPLEEAVEAAVGWCP
ncbi:phosphomevalonate kinase-like [Pollicipes pollicipes]|uniref:phosphomevalonate kinase-like n=1 Tax=Pollicipes pollicipes TaxID=41117 RepID=UPI001884D86E|nr:phosphomevalonate kinase-like [Pollicipes pollicipes]XP_037083308.1 phosphomevalonate kinase-like [Pollicipes pollicipes]